MLMTSFYKLGTDTQFDKCLPDTLREEGGYSNDAHDPGGMTMQGVTQREYDIWRRANGLATQWVKNITADEMRSIYYFSYWLPHCLKLPHGLDLCMFDTNVNNGTHAGVLLLQRALSIAADGVWGPQTESEVQNIRDANVPNLIVRFYQVRASYYSSLRNFRYFGKAWLRRDLEIEKWALAMVQGEAQA
jgi:lysozyme family protein